MLGLKSQKRAYQFDAYPLMFDLVLKEPPQIRSLLRAVVDEYPAGGTFFDDAISYLPTEEFYDVVAHAVQKLKQSRQNVAAESLIAQASL